MDALKPSYLGTVIDDLMFTSADGTTCMRRAEVVAERPGGGVTMAVLNEQGARDGASVLSAVTALKALGPPTDPIGSSVSGAEWPALATLVGSIDPASVSVRVLVRPGKQPGKRPANSFGTGAIEIM